MQDLRWRWLLKNWLMYLMLWAVWMAHRYQQHRLATVIVIVIIIF